MSEVHQKIKLIERDIEQIKPHFHLGRLSLAFSKKRIRQLEHDLANLVKKLPQDEQEIYQLRKEFGKEF